MRQVYKFLPKKATTTVLTMIAMMTKMRKTDIIKTITTRALSLKVAKNPLQIYIQSHPAIPDPLVT